MFGYLNEVFALASSRKSDTVFIGDWNLEPHENILGYSDFAVTAVLAHLADEAAVGGYAPTRWKGRRAIDYVMMPVGQGLKGRAVGFMPDVFGDHKGMLFLLQGKLHVAGTVVLAPTGAGAFESQ